MTCLSILSLRPKAGAFAWIAALLLAAVVAAGCSGNASSEGQPSDQRKKMTLPVSVGVTEEKIVPIRLRAVGNVEAYSTVSVKSQVDGEVIKVHFTEGVCVKTGTPLFTIDPRPFQTQLKQMEATLARDRAQLENALKGLERNASVVGKGYVSREQYDQATANASALKATIQADEAAIENVKLQLNYCFINSPIDGCLGALKVNRGNVVKGNDATNPLVIINQVSPIYVGFFIPERYLPDVKKYMASGELRVEASIPGHEEQACQGLLTFVNNSVDSSTGTILLKATFPNKDRSLWPGQFVNVVLTLTTRPGAIVVPSQAVQTGQQGQYVFVVKPDLTVEYRPILSERTVAGEAVIDQGLQVGEKVVTDGQLGLSQGVQVKIVEAVARSKGDSHS